jgi:hypothetical protein
MVQPEFLTVAEAAAMARLKTKSLYSLIEKGKVGKREGVLRRRHTRPQNSHILIDRVKFRRAFIGQSEEPKSQE